MSAPATSGAEDRARRLLAAYPWRMRAEQGDEIVATVLDTLPAGATRLPWRTAVDLVRGGLRTRRQRRPPLLTCFAFWMGRTIHPRWIWWAYDQLEDPRYRPKALVRRGVMGVVAYLPVLALYRNLGNAVVGMVVWAAMAAVAYPLWGERERNMLRARHGLVAGGSDPGQVWVRTTTRGGPNLSIAAPAAALGLPLSLGAMLYAWAVQHQRHWSVGSEELYSRPAPADLWSHVTPYVIAGTVVGALVALIGLRAGRRSAGGADPSPIAVSVATSVVAFLGGVAVALGALALALTTHWQWASWAYSYPVAVLGPVGVGLLVLAARLGLVGWRRGHPVGLWDVVPRSAPRPTIQPVARWSVTDWEAVEPWQPGCDEG